jgi:hypothetical protein
MESGDLMLLQNLFTYHISRKYIKYIEKKVKNT